MPKPKAQARSSRVAVETGPFGQAGFGGFHSATSSLSYLAEFPDTSSIADPHVVVIFKNLAKRDATTKARALEELQNNLSDSLSDDAAVDAAVVSVWTGMYPRTSIDSSRRVRQLAHTVQKLICLSAGKRIASSLPLLVGSWLLGLHDSDKVVSNAAQAGLFEVFSTPEKRIMVRKAYQEQLLDLAQAAIVNETPQTLSDERVVTPDEANAKYHRTVNAGLGLTQDLILSLSSEDVSKFTNQYTELLSEPKFWAAASLPDPTTRRSFHKLLSCILDSSLKSLVETSRLSLSYVERGLKDDQKGSATDFLDALIKITTIYPSIWAENWQGKKAPYSALQNFTSRGTQGALPIFWSKLTSLLSLLPKSAFPDIQKNAERFIDSYHRGLTRKDEPKAYLLTGLKEMFLATPHVVSRLSAAERQEVISGMVLPIVRSYLTPGEESKWSLVGPRSGDVFPSMAKLDGTIDAVKLEWPRITEMLVAEMKLSLPEQSAQFKVSQDKLISLGERWCQLLSFLLKHSEPNDLQAHALKAFEEAREASVSRNGKPYGVTSIIGSLVSKCPSFFKHGVCRENLEQFIKSDLATIFLSPSILTLSQILKSCHSFESFTESWSASFLQARNSDDQPLFGPRAVIQLFLALPRPEFRFDNTSREKIVQYTGLHVQRALEGKESWDLASAFLSGVFDKDMLQAGLGHHLFTAVESQTVLSATAVAGFLHLARSNPLEFPRLVDTLDVSKIVTHLLLLTESGDEDLANTAAQLKSILLSTSKSTAGDSSSNATGIASVIWKNLEISGTDAILVPTLISEALALAKTKGAESATMLLPPTESWRRDLERIGGIVPPLSLSVTSVFRNGVFLVEQPKRDESGNLVAYDLSGLSISMRQAIYTIALLNEDFDITTFEPAVSAQILELLALTTVLASENLSVAKSNALFLSDDPDAIKAVVEYVSDSQHAMNSWLEKSKNESSFVDAALSHLLVDSKGSSAMAYHSALAYNMIASHLVESRAMSSEASTEISSQVTALRKSNADMFYALTYLSSYRSYLVEVPIASRWFNDIIANLSANLLGGKLDEELRQLCILHTMMNDPDDNLLGTTASHRKLLLFKKLTSRLGSTLAEGQVHAPRTCCTLAVLNKLSTQLADVYGDHWEELITSCVKILADYISNTGELGSGIPENISMVYETLQLYRSLMALQKVEDCNEDLVEALAKYKESFYLALLKLVYLERTVSDENHQPLRIVDELIQRMLSNVPETVPIQVEELYPVLSTSNRSEALQLCAFRLLHSAIPKLQPQLSIDVVLEKKNVNLPDELLSLIMQDPNFDPLQPPEELEAGSLVALKGYFLSWLLVFDHFGGASHILREQYMVSLKEGDYLEKLLDLTSRLLRLGTIKPITRSNLAISFFEPNDSDEPLEQALDLATHLFYLALLHLPFLSRTWFADIRSRGLSLGVQGWTEKYVSPRVIETLFKGVQVWADEQEKATDDGKPMNIKTYIPLAEIISSYTIAMVDIPDQSTVSGITEAEFDVAICIKFPKTWPLHTVQVKSVTSRSTFDEKRWSSWLRTCQGIISHRNDDGVVDGLLSWKRNVAGAVEGKSECTICYALIAEDGKLPSKKCRTCRNVFHGWCLQKWFTSSGEKKCPLCRTDFFEGDGGKKGRREVE